MSTNGKRILKTDRLTDRLRQGRGGKRLAPPPERPAKQPKPRLRERAGTGRRRWRLRKKDLWFLIVPAVAAAIAVAVLLWTEHDVTSYTMEGSPRQYYLGNAYALPESGTLRRTPQDKTVLDSGGIPSEVSSLPVYYAREGVATLPQDMDYYAPRSGMERRLPYFTELSAASNGAVTASRDGKDKALAPGFAFDGQNLYLFLEPMIVEFNGYRLELPPLSFVDAMNYGDIVVFNYETKDFLIEEARSAVTARTADGDYSVSLLGDSLTGLEGQRALLVTRPELLESIF